MSNDLDQVRRNLQREIVGVKTALDARNEVLRGHAICLEALLSTVRMPPRPPA